MHPNVQKPRCLQKPDKNVYQNLRHASSMVKHEKHISTTRNAALSQSAVGGRTAYTARKEETKSMRIFLKRNFIVFRCSLSRKPKRLSRQLLEIIRLFIKVADYRTHTQQSILFLVQ